MTEPRASLRACRRGATALEFALIAPVLLLLLIGTIDAGRYFWADAALHDAAARAARCVALTPQACTMRRGLASAGAPAGARFALRRAACGPQIEARLRFRPLLPLPAARWPLLRARACLP